MFSYSDPSGHLSRVGALSFYQSLIHAAYVEASRVPSSMFAPFEAFARLRPADVERQRVDWLAFPRLADATPEAIDRDRFTHQEEYAEWQPKLRPDGTGFVTLVTQFPEYYAALAMKGAAELARAVQQLYPDANPTEAELFGNGGPAATASAEERARRFIANRRRNPYNDGTRGILCLGHRDNTLGALFGLASFCGTPADGAAEEVCGNGDGACVPGRNSDPQVCLALQKLARDGMAFTLADPAGIEIVALDGIWELEGLQIDLEARGLWRTTDGGRRATLKIVPGLTLAGEPVTSGEQVARRLTVGVTVLVAPDRALPSWARAGNESSRRIS